VVLKSSCLALILLGVLFFALFPAQICPLTSLASQTTPTETLNPTEIFQTAVQEAVNSIQTASAAVPPGSAPPVATTSPTNELFHADFEDLQDLDEMFPSLTTTLSITSDGTGNSVLDFDNTRNEAYAEVDFGHETWEDLQIEYRVRVLHYSGDAPVASVLFHFTEPEPCCSFYALVIHPEEEALTLEYQEEGSDERQLGGALISDFDEGCCTIRIVSDDNQIVVYVNDKPEPVMTITRLPVERMGFVQLQIAPGAHVQFDDIRVLDLSDG
jgi:hypothetical protein